MNYGPNGPVVSAPDKVGALNLESRAVLASGDLFQRISFWAQNSSGVRTRYARIDAIANVLTSGSEDGVISIFGIASGSQIQFARFTKNGLGVGTRIGQSPNTLNADAIYIKDIKVIGDRSTGWSAMTGTGSKSALVAAGAGTASGSYTASELQGALNRIAALEARLKSYDDALFAHGLIGS
jgi:hypothetical protein